MNPHDNTPNPRATTPLRPQARLGVSSERAALQQQATANIIRGQLESIYQGGSGEATPHTTPMPTPAPVAPAPEPSQTTDEKPAGHGLRTAPAPATDEVSDQVAQTEEPATSPYQRTMHATYGATPTENQWQQYHEAWQKYYQLYYERHYLNQVHTQKKIQQEVTETIAQAPLHSDQDSSLSSREAMNELRQTIRQKVIDSAQKVKKSRHFTPALAGFIVLIAVAFLQWNGLVFGYLAAYASPGSAQPQNIIPDAVVNIDVSPEPRMIIPKINLDAPVVYGVGPDYNSQMTAMEKGIAHFAIAGANAVPGQVGNAVFAAHSSNDVFARGDYKQIFAANERLAKGDIIYMNFESKRYVYSVTKTEVVMPNEVSRVQLQTDKPMLTLVSCVPLGTAQKRLLVFAEQVSPDPAKAEAATEDITQASSATIPGRPSPTLIERLFGAQ